MRNLFIFTFLSFLFASITTTAFEDDKKNNNGALTINKNMLDNLLKDNYVKNIYCLRRDTIREHVEFCSGYDLGADFHFRFYFNKKSGFRVSSRIKYETIWKGTHVLQVEM